MSKLRHTSSCTLQVYFIFAFEVQYFRLSYYTVQRCLEVKREEKNSDLLSCITENGNSSVIGYAPSQCKVGEVSEKPWIPRGTVPGIKGNSDKEQKRKQMQDEY